MSEIQQQALEVRVHGIGDKDALSSLGPATVVATVADGRADVVRPPRVPRHRLLLVNWSRWNRTGWAVAWILCWPFTVLNASGEMRPAHGRASRVHAVLTHSVSVLGTVVGCVWVAAACEVIARIVPMPNAWEGQSGALGVAVGGAVLLAVLHYRASIDDRPPRAVTAAHAVAVLAVCGAAVALRPSQRVIDIDTVLFRGLAVDSYTTPDLQRMPAVYATGGDAGAVHLTQYVDPLACLGYLSLALVGVMLLVGMAAEKAPSTQCALIAGAIATALINLYGAIVFALAKTAVNAVSGFSVLRRLLPSEQRPDDAVLIGRTGEGFSTRVLPLVAVLAVVVTLVVVALVAARFPVGTLRRDDRREAINRWAHNDLPSTGGRLTNAMWVASVLVLLLVEFLGLGIGVLADRWGGYQTINNVETFSPGRPATVLLYGAGLLLTGALAFLRSAPLRARLTRSLAFVGDVIGFWPIHTHPFAARSYRPAALEAISRAMSEPGDVPTVLVGHSQGSVLAAWHVAHTPGRRHALVTCGSPLRSLYAQFFPGHFDEDLFGRVTANTRYWVNVWRATDPIATSIPQADDNRESIDPTADGELRCHSHYWTDEQQTRAVEDVLGTAGTPLSRALGADPQPQVQP